MKQIFFQPLLSETEINFNMCGGFKANHIYRFYENAVEAFPDHKIIAIPIKDNDELKRYEVIDDIEFKTPTFYVDIPQCKGDGTPSEEWRNIFEAKTKEEVLAYAKEHLGADDNGMICVISQS